MKLHIPGLPQIVQYAFDTLLNKGIGRDNLANDVLSGMIYESGSNANGEYVRWGNGIQICWEYGLEITYAYGGAMHSYWTFPATFLTPVRVNFTVGSAADEFQGGITTSQLGLQFSTANTTTVECGYFKAFGAADFQSGHKLLNVFASAVGRWK